MDHLVLLSALASAALCALLQMGYGVLSVVERAVTWLHLHHWPQLSILLQL